MVLVVLPSTAVIEDSSCLVQLGECAERMEPGHPREFLSVVSSSRYSRHEYENTEDLRILQHIATNI